MLTLVCLTAVKFAPALAFVIPAMAAVSDASPIGQLVHRKRNREDRWQSQRVLHQARGSRSSGSIDDPLLELQEYGDPVFSCARPVVARRLVCARQYDGRSPLLSCRGSARVE